MLIVSSMYFIWEITHFRFWKLRVLVTLELYTLYLNVRCKWFTKRQLWSKTSVKTKMALCGFKIGNVTFSERYNRSWFHKFCACVHSWKIWCGNSSYNSQNERLDWEIIPDWNSFLLRYSTLLRSFYWKIRIFVSNVPRRGILYINF